MECTTIYAYTQSPLAEHKNIICCSFSAEVDSYCALFFSAKNINRTGNLNILTLIIYSARMQPQITQQQQKNNTISSINNAQWTANDAATQKYYAARYGLCTCV